MSDTVASVQFHEFDVQNKDDRYNRWIRWITKLIRYYEHENVVEDKKKINSLFLFGGYDLEEAYKEAKSKRIEENSESKKAKSSVDTGEENKQAQGSNTTETFDNVIDILTKSFNPKEKILLNRCKIRQIKQFKDEPFDEFLARVKECASQCKLENVESEIVTQVINGCQSYRLKAMAAKREDISLADLIKEANIMEAITQMKNDEARNFDNDDNDDDDEPRSKRSVNNIQRPQKSINDDARSTRGEQKRTCIYCGGNYPHEKQCPAKNKICNHCGKLNHFESVCRSKASNQNTPSKRKHVRKIDLETSLSSNWMIKAVNAVRSLFMPLVSLLICQTWVSICVDTGAQVNIIDEQTFCKLKDKPALYKSKTTLFGYNNSKPIDLLGEFTTRVKSNAESRYIFSLFSPSSAHLIDTHIFHLHTC